MPAGVAGPVTGFQSKDPNTNTFQDLGARYLTKAYLIDSYPNLVPANMVAGGWSSGLGTSGQLGNSAHATVSTPVQIGTLNVWKQVSVGINFGMGVQNNGNLWGWGINTNGALGNGTRTTSSSPIIVGALTTWKQVSCGKLHTIGVTTGGTVWAWGLGTSGQLGNGQAASSYSSPVQVGALTTWKYISAGQNVSAGITSDGKLWMWGINTNGILGNNSVGTVSTPIQVGTLTNWKQVCCGPNAQTAAVKTDGTLWTWGGNTDGALGNNNQGTKYSSPVAVGALTNWKQVSVGSNHMAAVKTDGTLWTWGLDTSGQLGVGDNATLYSSPIQVGSLTNWKQVQCGYNTCWAVKTDGTLWAWGDGTSGALGNGTTTKVSSPVQIGSLTTWKFIAGQDLTFSAIADGYI